MALWAVVAAASVRFHVRLVAGGVDAFLGQTNHAFADLLKLVVSCFHGDIGGSEDLHLQPERGWWSA